MCISINWSFQFHYAQITSEMECLFWAHQKSLRSKIFAMPMIVVQSIIWIWIATKYCHCSEWTTSNDSMPHSKDFNLIFIWLSFFDDSSKQIKKFNKNTFGLSSFGQYWDNPIELRSSIINLACGSMFLHEKLTHPVWRTETTELHVNIQCYQSKDVINSHRL